MTGKKNHLEWNYITPFVLERTVASGVTEDPDSLVPFINLGGERIGNSNIIFVAACLDSALAAENVIDALTVELWAGYTEVGVATEYWVKVAEDVSANIVHGKLIRFEDLPPGHYKAVIRVFTSAGNNLHVLTAHTE